MTEGEAVGRLTDLTVLRVEAGAWFERLRAVIQDSPLDSVAEDMIIATVGNLLQLVDVEISGVFESYVDLLVDMRNT